MPGFRHDATRNPATYSDVNQCKLNGIDIDILEFEPMPTRGIANSGPDESKKGLSIAEAKAG